MLGHYNVLDFDIGLHFTVITDCQCLVYLNAWKTKNAQKIRWMSEISEYDLDIKNCPGVQMQHADALSQAPIHDSSNEILKIETREGKKHYVFKDPIAILF